MYFGCLQKFFSQVLAALEKNRLFREKTSSQSKDQDIMEQVSNDLFSKKYKKYNLHDKEKLGKLCTFFLSVLLLFSVLLLVYLDFTTLYYYFALYYYSERKSNEQ